MDIYLHGQPVQLRLAAQRWPAPVQGLSTRVGKAVYRPDALELYARLEADIERHRAAKEAGGAQILRAQEVAAAQFRDRGQALVQRAQRTK